MIYFLIFFLLNIKFNFYYKILLLLFTINNVIYLNFILIDNNKITVIIPTYNRANLIVKSVKSIINQSYRNIEVIIVDDCSSDNTKQRLNEINDTRIRYIKLRKNKGACIARNIGIKKATGEYITFQDSDDISHFKKLEKQIQNLIKHNSDFDFCQLKLYYFNKTNYKVVPFRYQHKQIMENKTIEALCNGNFISTSSILIKRSIIQKYLFIKNIPRLQDYDLILRMIPDLKYSYTQKPLITLYIRNDSISHSDEKLKQSIKILFENKYKLNTIQNDIFIKYLNRTMNRLLNKTRNITN